MKLAQQVLATCKTEAVKVPDLPTGLSKSYLVKNTIQSKSVKLIDGKEWMGGRFWVGKLSKKDGYALVFFSFDLGAPFKVQNFPDASSAMKVFDKIGSEIHVDAAYKLFKN